MKSVSLSLSLWSGSIVHVRRRGVLLRCQRLPVVLRQAGDARLRLLVGWPEPLSLKRSRLVSVISRGGLQIVPPLTWAGKGRKNFTGTFSKGESLFGCLLFKPAPPPRTPPPPPRHLGLLTGLNNGGKQVIP